MSSAETRIDLDNPLWDQNTFMGRVKYFAWVTDPRLSLSSTTKIMAAKTLLQQYRAGTEPPTTTRPQVLSAQQLYLSAFHPDTGDLQNVIGRMSCYVPAGMVLIGAMTTFYKSTPAVIFWQWANQSYNALVNYTNRNAKSDISTNQLGIAYLSATGSALVTALGLKAFLATRASPLMQRFVPFAAVAASNMVNIPLMRQSELLDGIPVYDEAGHRVGESQYGAVKGISQVTFSRILIASPSMLLLPLLMERVEKTAFLKKYGFVNAPMQVFLSGLTLLVMVPVGCALFNQKCSISTNDNQWLTWKNKMSPEEMADLNKRYPDGKLPERVFFNKGL